MFLLPVATRPEKSSVMFGDEEHQQSNKFNQGLHPRERKFFELLSVCTTSMHVSEAIRNPALNFFFCSGVSFSVSMLASFASPTSRLSCKRDLVIAEATGGVKGWGTVKKKAGPPTFEDN